MKPGTIRDPARRRHSYLALSPGELAPVVR
jgi:hypothetical protein